MRKRLLFLLQMVLMMLLLSAQPALAKTYVYYGNRLDRFNKVVYAATVKNAKKGLGTTWIDTSSYSSPSLRRGLASFIVNDHPEIYWINGYTIRTYSSWNESGVEFTPSETWKNAAKKKSAFNKKVKAVVQKLKKQCKGKSTARRARIILEYLAANCSYAYTTYDQTAYGVFMKKKAVCAGYARAYKLLCDQLGVTCICVEGQVNGEGHMVNYVKIGKKWYFVDPTWCDQGKTANVRYFLLGRNTSGCSVTHSVGIKMPALTAKDYPMTR